MARSQIIKFLFANFGYKCAAIGLAAVIWYIVQGEEILEVNAKLDIKVDVARGYLLKDGDFIARDITLRGPRVLVGAMQGKALQAVIAVPAGKTGNLRYRLDKEFIPKWDNRVRLTIHDPYVTLGVEERQTKKLHVKPLMIGEIDPGYIIEELKISPSDIEVTGAKSDLSKLNELGTNPIDLSGLKASKTSAISIARAALPDVEMSVHDVSVTIKLAPKKP